MPEPMPEAKESEPLLPKTGKEDEVGRKLKEPLKSQAFMKDFFKEEEDKRRRQEEERVEAANLAAAQKNDEIEAQKRLEMIKKHSVAGLGILLVVALIVFGIYQVMSSSASPTAFPTPSPTIHFNQRTLPPTPAPTVSLSPTPKPTIDFDQWTLPPSSAPTIDFSQWTLDPTAAPTPVPTIEVDQRTVPPSPSNAMSETKIYHGQRHLRRHRR